MKLSRANYEQNLNGSIYYSIQLINTTGGFDGWGFACSLPLLFMIYENEQDSNYLKLFENQLLDLISEIQTSNKSITRKRYSGDTWVNWQYLPSNAFIVASLVMYYTEIFNPSVYLFYSTEEITSVSFKTDILRCRVTNTFGSSSSESKVYCGDIGEPIAIYSANGTLTWSYNTSTTILTLNATHAGPTKMLVYWRTPGDVNDDCIVDIFDIGCISAHWYPGPPIGPLGYDANADVNGDGAVDISDIGIASAHLGAIFVKQRSQDF